MTFLGQGSPGTASSFWCVWWNIKAEPFFKSRTDRATMFVTPTITYVKHSKLSHDVILCGHWTTAEVSQLRIIISALILNSVTDKVTDVVLPFPTPLGLNSGVVEERRARLLVIRSCVYLVERAIQLLTVHFRCTLSRSR